MITDGSGFFLAKIIVIGNFILQKCQVYTGANKYYLAKRRSQVYCTATSTSHLYLISGSLLREDGSNIDRKLPYTLYVSGSCVVFQILLQIGVHLYSLISETHSLTEKLSILPRHI